MALLWGEEVRWVGSFFISLGMSCRFVIGCRFSSLHLWTSVECAYCMAIILTCLNVFLIFITRSLSFVSKFFIDRMCVVALAPETKTMSEATFHPFVMNLLPSGWYFVVFLPRVCATNLSIQ